MRIERVCVELGTNRTLGANTTELWNSEAGRTCLLFWGRCPGVDLILVSQSRSPGYISAFSREGTRLRIAVCRSIKSKYYGARGVDGN